MDMFSTRPYFIRALHEWCSDYGLTPYLTVAVDANVRVPPEGVQDGKITLNIGYDATGNLTIDNEFISFKARFSGVARDITVPIDNVLAIYARENGIGMRFDLDEAAASKIAASPVEPPDPPDPPGRPQLKRVK